MRTKSAEKLDACKRNLYCINVTPRNFVKYLTRAIVTVTRLSSGTIRTHERMRFCYRDFHVGKRSENSRLCYRPSYQRRRDITRVTTFPIHATSRDRSFPFFLSRACRERWSFGTSTVRNGSSRRALARNSVGTRFRVVKSISSEANTCVIRRAALEIFAVHYTPELP